MINFGVVFTILYIFALKPLSKLMAERAERIAKGVDDAKKNESMLKATCVEYDEVLVKAKNEANKIFQQGKKEAEAEKASMIETAKVQAEGIIANGKKMLEAEKVRIVEEAKKDITSLSMLATEKLIKSKQDLNNL